MIENNLSIFKSQYSRSIIENEEISKNIFIHIIHFLSDDDQKNLMATQKLWSKTILNSRVQYEQNWLKHFQNELLQESPITLIYNFEKNINNLPSLFLQMMKIQVVIFEKIKLFKREDYNVMSISFLKKHLVIPSHYKMLLSEIDKPCNEEICLTGNNTVIDLGIKSILYFLKFSFFTQGQKCVLYHKVFDSLFDQGKFLSNFSLINHLFNLIPTDSDSQKCLNNYFLEKVELYIKNNCSIDTIEQLLAFNREAEKIMEIYYVDTLKRENYSTLFLDLFRIYPGCDTLKPKFYSILTDLISFRTKVFLNTKNKMEILNVNLNSKTLKSITDYLLTQKNLSSAINIADLMQENNSHDMALDSIIQYCYQHDQLSYILEAINRLSPNCNKRDRYFALINHYFKKLKYEEAIDTLILMPLGPDKDAIGKHVYVTCILDGEFSAVKRLKEFSKTQ